MSRDAEALLALIPAVYRLRDAAEGRGLLKALAGAIGEQLEGVDRTIDQSYEDLFIETCADWVVPYLGDLIGYTPLSGATAAVRSPRLEVANTLSYRRRKGTLSVIEQLAADLTDWAVYAEEAYLGLAQTQHMKHLRPARTSTFDLRRPAPTLASDPIFLDAPRTIDVRRAGSGRGGWNIPNLILHVFRLRAVAIAEAEPGRPDPTQPTRLTFDPLGLDAPLFQAAAPGREKRPERTPRPASPRRLHAELDGRRKLLAGGGSQAQAKAAAVAFGADPVFRISIGASEIAPEAIRICDLSTWRPAGGAGIKAAVDPRLGRIALVADPGAEPVSVAYRFGAVGDVGAMGLGDAPAGANATVERGEDLAAAVAAALGQPQDAVVTIDASARFAGDLAIDVPAGRRFTLAAGQGRRPVIAGAIKAKLGEGAVLDLRGLVVLGLEVAAAKGGAVALERMTLRPGAGGLGLVWTAAGGGEARLDRVISAPLKLPQLVDLTLERSIVDAGDDASSAIEAGTLILSGSTVFGRIAIRAVELIENAIVTGDVTSARRQHGCVRFSWLTPASSIPKPYRCQPGTAMREAAEQLRIRTPGATSAMLDEAARQAGIAAAPDFVSLSFGAPGYAQLGARSSAAVLEGADDGSEMGVFQELEEAHRVRNLRRRIAEHLRLGLDARVDFAN